MEVMKHVREVLEGMRVEIMPETEYKYRCVRQPGKKGVVGVQPTQIGSAATAGGTNDGDTSVDANGQKDSELAAFTTLGNAASHHPRPPAELAFDDENCVVISLSPPISEGLPSAAAASGAIVVMQETTCGDPTQDFEDEVRFSVELTRIDRLDHMFSLDISERKSIGHSIHDF